VAGSWVLSVVGVKSEISLSVLGTSVLIFSMKIAVTQLVKNFCAFYGL
jgi:hypothetical protein